MIFLWLLLIFVFSLIGFIVGVSQNPAFSGVDVEVLDFLWLTTDKLWRNHNDTRLTRTENLEIAKEIIENNYIKCCEKYCKHQEWKI